MKRKIVALGCVCCLTAIMSMSVFAAMTSFSTNLPIKQQDVEVSKVKKAYTTKYWVIDISSIGTGTSMVNAWTELSYGQNLSSPNKQVGTGISVIDYTSIPSVGQNVVLNLDNPVYSTSTVAVKGRWTPN